MRAGGPVTLIKSRNKLAVEPTTNRIADLLCPALRLVEKRPLRGREKFDARQKGRSEIEITEWDLFTHDHKNRLVTSWGFYWKLRKLLRQAGYHLQLEDLTPPPRPEIFEPRWDKVFEDGTELRWDQDKVLAKIASHPCGRFDCPTGYGKTFLVGLVGLMYPKARIDFVTKRLAVLRNEIYPELCGMLPSVGICCSGQRVLGRRVMCYSAGCLHHADGTADILIADEVHELAADSYAEKLGKYERSRNYGFSASQEMRWDGKDMRLEAIFGPIIHRISYADAQEHGLVVPIEVLWTDVVMDEDPADGFEDAAKKRHGIWRNSYRNRLIVADANRYDDDTQVLITVETLDHAVRLAKLLPEFTLVYAVGGLSAEKRHQYIDQKLLPEDHPRMTLERYTKLKKRFESGKLKKCIVTTTWNVGVNFRQLATLIRAEGGSSPITSTQVPGRTSRIFDGKQAARVHDYRDQFNPGFRWQAKQRAKTYEKHGWTQQSRPIDDDED